MVLEEQHHQPAPGLHMLPCGSGAGSGAGRGVGPDQIGQDPPGIWLNRPHMSCEGPETGDPNPSVPLRSSCPSALGLGWGGGLGQKVREEGGFGQAECQHQEPSPGM